MREIGGASKMVKGDSHMMSTSEFALLGDERGTECSVRDVI